MKRNHSLLQIFISLLGGVVDSNTKFYYDDGCFYYTITYYTLMNLSYLFPKGAQATGTSSSLDESQQSASNEIDIDLEAESDSDSEDSNNGLFCFFFVFVFVFNLLSVNVD